MEMVLGTSLLKHTLMGTLSVVGNPLHMISSETPCRCIRVLEDSKLPNGSCEPSYAFTCGIQNLAGRGKEVTYAMKGKSVHWISLSKLVDTRTLRAFIIMSIFSFIVCISCAMRNTSTSSSKGRLVSYWSHLLTALLSSWSSFSWWPFIGGWLLSRSSLSCPSF